jgi:hypothetical protein
MRNSKLVYFLAGAAVATMCSAATYSLDANAPKAPKKSGSHVLLSPEDFIEIQQIMSMYPRDVDPGSVRDASWMFAKEDGVAEIGKRMTTTEEIKAFYENVRNTQAKGGGVRHLNSSYVVVGTPDGGARGSSYMLGVETKQKGGHPEIALFGKYEDRYVKTPEGWRIKERIWKADSYRGSMEEVSPSPIPGDK